MSRNGWYLQPDGQLDKREECLSAPPRRQEITMYVARSRIKVSRQRCLHHCKGGVELLELVAESASVKSSDGYFRPSITVT